MANPIDVVIDVFKLWWGMYSSFPLPAKIGMGVFAIWGTLQFCWMIQTKNH